MSSSQPLLGSTPQTADPKPLFAQLQTPTSDQFVLEDEPHYTQRRCIPSPCDPYQSTHPPTRNPSANELAYLSDDLSLPPPRAPSAAHQHPGRHAPSPTSNLTVQIPKGHLAITPSFTSPFADVSPPSPVLAWSPDERRAFSSMSAAGEKGWSEYGEKKNGALRKRSDDGEAIFWNRFSIGIHQSKNDQPKSTWLRKHDGRVSVVRVCSWLGAIVIAGVVVGLLVWHFL